MLLVEGGNPIDSECIIFPEIGVLVRIDVLALEVIEFSFISLFQGGVSPPGQYLSRVFTFG